MPHESAIQELTDVAGVIIDYEDIRERLSELQLDRAFDHDGDGVADVQTLQGCVRDAEAEVIAAIGMHNPAEVQKLPETSHQYLKTMTLEMFEGYMACRITRFSFSFDGEERKKTVRRQLDKVRLNKLILLGAAEPTNSGGDQFSYNPDLSETERHQWLDGFEDYGDF